jgi:hypothetical protein
MALMGAEVGAARAPLSCAFGLPIAAVCHMLKCVPHAQTCCLCWAARAQQLIFYPSAIGSEPPAPDVNSYPHWVRTMCGHAAANLVRGVCAAGMPLESYRERCAHVDFAFATQYQASSYLPFSTTPWHRCPS